MIADVARKAADAGWQMFVYVMAMISVNLGLMNLIPLPVLDGFHVLSAASRASAAGRCRCASGRSPTWSGSRWCSAHAVRPAQRRDAEILRVAPCASSRWDSSSPLLSCALWEDGRALAESLHPEKAGDVLPEALLALAPLESVDALAAGVGPGRSPGCASASPR